ncbi:MAG TPA: M48 family metallopeptidase, partial [Negativicutes bacterium]
IGRDVGKQLEKQYGLVEDAALQERVNRIGMSMVAVSDRRNLPYSFKVLNSSEVNALAAPGGFIYIFKGLVDLMPSDDELAGVIGHELGHVVRRHTVHQIEKSMGIGLLFGVVFGGRGALLQNLAYNAIMAGYSRADEREADHLGFIHSFRAGYNPYSMTMGLTKLAELDPKSHNDLFSDHPEGQARLALVQQYLNEAKVYPQVRPTANGKAAQVVDGDWALPAVEADYAGNKPLNRAYSTAGRLYRLAQLPDYNSDNYILDSDGSNVIVYYNDQLILTVTPQDGAAHDMSAMELAGMYAGKLREWNIHVALDKAG